MLRYIVFGFGIEARALVPCPPGCRGHAIMELAMPPSVREATHCTFPKRTYCTQAIIIYTLASPLYHVCVIVCVCYYLYAVPTCTTMCVVGVICFATSMVTAGSSVQSGGC